MNAPMLNIEEQLRNMKMMVIVLTAKEALGEKSQILNARKSWTSLTESGK